MIELPDFAGHATELWNALIDVAEAAPTGWVLVGGQMVLLHALEHNIQWPRVSTHLDVIVNARVGTAMRTFVGPLEDLGFVPISRPYRRVTRSKFRVARKLRSSSLGQLGMRAERVLRSRAFRRLWLGEFASSVEMDNVG